jgi:hypothetical protein
VYERKIWVSAVNVEFIEIDSISCSPEELVFETPKLHVLCSYNGFKRIGQGFLSNGQKLLTTRDIIEICCGISVSLSSTFYYISLEKLINFK